MAIVANLIEKKKRCFDVSLTYMSEIFDQLKKNNFYWPTIALPLFVSVYTVSKYRSGVIE